MNFVPARIEGETIKMPFGDAPMSPEIRQKLQSAPGGGGGGRDVIAGVRPEHFEDARLDDATQHRLKFRAQVDVVESMGSELYAYFEIKGAEDVHSDQLDELAADAGMEDLPSSGAQIVARLDAASSARAGGEIELSLDCAQIKLFDPQGGKSLLHAG
jgi:multiple sugar transport system ATP-binding protein